MVGTVLLVVNEGFNDMAFMASQVILVEHNFDVIISSRENTAIKGQDSSVIAISLEEALSHGVDYVGMILVGGSGMNDWDLLKESVQSMMAENRIIGAIGNGVEFLRGIGISEELSDSDKVKTAGNIISLANPKNSEEFVDKYIELL